jgi:hypothetical protein
MVGREMKKQKAEARRQKPELKGILRMFFVLALAGCVIIDRKDEKVDQQIERNENRALLEGRLIRLSGEALPPKTQVDYQKRELANFRARVERLQVKPGDVSAEQVQRLQDLVKQAAAAIGQEQQILLDDGSRQLNLIENRNGNAPREPGGN